MQKTTGNRIKLGIFVSAGVALFIAGIYFIGEQQQLFSKTFHVNAVFKDINGLQIGNNVRFAGINVGIVENIEQVTDSTVWVDMIIQEESRKFMKKDAKALISSDGLMGNKIIVITPGKGAAKQLADGETLLTGQPVSVDEILGNLKVTSENSAKITSDLSAIIAEIRAGRGTIGMLLMDTTLAKNVGQTVVNIKQGAGGFKQNMNAASNNVLLRGFFKKKKKAAEKKEEAKGK